METNGPATKLVHVLRHTFEPNNAFGDALERFYPPGPHGSRFSFAVRSLVSLELPSALTARHRYDIAQARLELKRHEHHHFELDKRFAIKRLGAQAFVVFFRVHNEHDPARDESSQFKDVLPKNPQFEKHVADVYGSIGEGIMHRAPADTHFDVYTRVRASVAIEDDQLRSMAEGYQADFARVTPKLPFTIRPATLPGFDEEIPVRREQNLDKAS